MRTLIALAAIAVLGCSATDLMMFNVAMSSINSSLAAAQSAQTAQRVAALEADAARCREAHTNRPQCCPQGKYVQTDEGWRCTGCDEEDVGRRPANGFGSPLR